MAYGFAFSMPFAQVAAICLILSILISKERQSIPWNLITIIWVIYIILMGITTLTAYFPDAAAVQFEKTIKIQLVTFLTFVVITDFEKLKKLLWVIVLSIGYFSVKGGIFTIMTGGKNRVWGPPGGFIEDNNSLAIAILMIIPLMIYLLYATTNKWVKRGLFSSIILSLFSALGSQSRGALLAILVVGLFFWIKSQKKILSGILIIITCCSLFAFMPESWLDRMNTIEKYEQDDSAMGRLNAWKYAYNAANDNVLGMGFDSWSYETFELYAPNPLDMHAAHSIYFSVLADHGWIGLTLFVFIYFLTWNKLKHIIKKTNDSEELSEYNLLARMLQVSLIAYFVGGAFLSISYFDLPWHLVCFVVLLDLFLNKSQNNELENSSKRANEHIGDKNKRVKNSYSEPSR